MTADLYRDPQLGIRARIAELVVRLRDREAEVTDEFWNSLEADVRARMKKRRKVVDLLQRRTDMGFDELAAAEAELAGYVDELEEHIARLPAVEQEWRELPEDVAVPPRTPRPWGFFTPSFDEVQEFARGFASAVRDRGRSARILSDGPDSLLAQFTERGAPFALRATALANGKGQIIDVAMSLVTSVPRAMPRLLVRHETMALSFGKALGIEKEAEVGEPSFDGLFLIQGAKEAVARLLLPSVQGLLLALARFDIPTLEIDPPARVASLRWQYEPHAAALDAAIRVLASIRDKTARVRFRR